MSDKKVKAVEVRAEVRQIRTMADGSINVVLNLGEDCQEQAKVLLGWHNLLVHGLLTLTELDDETEKEPERTSPKVGRRRSTNRRDKQ